MWFHRVVYSNRINNSSLEVNFTSESYLRITRDNSIQRFVLPLIHSFDVLVPAGRWPFSKRWKTCAILFYRVVYYGCVNFLSLEINLRITRANLIQRFSVIKEITSYTFVWFVFLVYIGVDHFQKDIKHTRYHFITFFLSIYRGGPFLKRI